MTTSTKNATRPSESISTRAGILKSVARTLVWFPAVIQLVRFRLAACVLGPDRAFLGVSERLAGKPGFLGAYLRASVYGKLLNRCSRDVHIGYGTVLSKRAAVIEDHVYTGRSCSLGWVQLERDVMLADHVVIPSGGKTHSVAPGVPPRMMDNEYSVVRLGEGTWVGSSAVIMADVGRFCTIGAGAVVTKPIPDYSIAVGCPARVISTQRPAEADTPPAATASAH